MANAFAEQIVSVKKLEDSSASILCKREPAVTPFGETSTAAVEPTVPAEFSLTDYLANFEGIRVRAGDTHMERTASTEEPGFQFNPPVFIQRYRRVLEVILEHEKHIDKVVDFGCAELRFLQLLKNELKLTRHIIGVDVDREVIEKFSFRIMPLTCDYLARRELPLHVALYHGSMFDYDARVGDCDVVTLIEVIEHIQEQDLDKLVHNVFERLRPLLMLITTPNADFNSCFNFRPGQFRHLDHKFEWSREEFQSWCRKIVNNYSQYDVEFEGIGPHPQPEQYKDIGCCSQMAIIRRSKDGYLEDRAARSLRVRDEMSSATGDFVRPYSELVNITYPTKGQMISKRKRLALEVENVLRGLALDVASARDDAHEPLNVMDGKQGVIISVEKLHASHRIQPLCPDLSDLHVLLSEEEYIVDHSAKTVFYPLYDDCSDNAHASESEDEELPETGEESSCQDSWD